MPNCKELTKAQEETRRWRRIARRRRLDAEAQGEELTRVQRRYARIKALREEEREISEAYSQSAERTINSLSDELEALKKEKRKLETYNLPIPSEHSFAEHEAYLAAKAKVEELEIKLHECVCLQNELRCDVAEVLDFDKGSYDGCDVLKEVTELKHKYDNAMEVLAATTRQHDQLNSEINVLKIILITRDTELAELKKVLAPKVYQQ